MGLKYRGTEWWGRGMADEWWGDTFNDDNVYNGLGRRSIYSSGKKCMIGCMMHGRIWKRWYMIWYREDDSENSECVCIHWDGIWGVDTYWWMDLYFLHISILDAAVRLWFVTGFLVRFALVAVVWFCLFVFTRIGKGRSSDANWKSVDGVSNAESLKLVILGSNATEAWKQVLLLHSSLGIADSSRDIMRRAFDYLT